MTRALFLGLVVLAVVSTMAVAAPFCGLKDGNGDTVVDLTPLMDNVYKVPDTTNNKYDYDIVFCRNTEMQGCSKHDGNPNDAVAQVPKPGLAGTSCHTCGIWDDASLVIPLNSDDLNAGVQIVYYNGDQYNHVSQNRTSVLEVFCNPNFPDPKNPDIKFRGEQNQNGLEVYLFQVNTKFACKNGGGGGGGGGGGITGGVIFIIILACALAVYLAVGISIQLARGNRGAEALPNYAFWKDFFTAVGDGMALVFCCRTPTPGSGSSGSSGATTGQVSYAAKTGGAEGYQNI